METLGVGPLLCLHSGVSVFETAPQRFQNLLYSSQNDPELAGAHQKPCSVSWKHGRLALDDNMKLQIRPTQGLLCLLYVYYPSNENDKIKAPKIKKSECKATSTVNLSHFQTCPCEAHATQSCTALLSFWFCDYSSLLDFDPRTRRMHQSTTVTHSITMHNTTSSLPCRGLSCTNTSWPTAKS